MQREKIASGMIAQLQKKLNCENVRSFVKSNVMDNLLSKSDRSNAITVANVLVDYESINYADKDDKSISQLYKLFDFMVESNYTGFEYFPYIYGVLPCVDNISINIHLFYEYFEADLVYIIDEIEHQSEWYDIIFQFVIINNYLSKHNIEYEPSMKSFAYRKIAPYYKEYVLSNYQFKINHKYLIVVRDFNMKVSVNNQNQFVRYIQFIYEYVNGNVKIKIPPSGRIIKLLNELVANPNDFAQIMDKYYNLTN